MSQKEIWGDFEVDFSEQGLIGEGGFSRVYRARQVSLDRTVAFKVFDPAAQNHPAAVLRELVVRVQNEGRVLARLKHANITDVIAAGEKEGRLYIAMEYVDGENLAQYLARHTEAGRVIEAREIVRIASAVVAALKAAYDCVAEDGRPCRIIHRDVKPSNILVGRRGQVKMTDFGLARVVAPPRDTGRPATRPKDERVTRFGSEIGTPHYMAPEAFGGLEKVDHRSDIYSLGCVLFELIAKKPPFSGEWDELRKRHAEEPAELPPQAVPHVPASLVALVMRCLEKRPECRFQTYEELEQALRGVEKELDAREPADVPASAPGGRMRFVSRTVCAMVLVTLAVIAASWAMRRHPKGTTFRPEVRETPTPEATDSGGASTTDHALEESKPEKEESKRPTADPRPEPPSEQPVKSAKPRVSPVVLAASVCRDTFAMIVEYGIVQRRAETILAAHRDDLRARKYDGTIAALNRLVEEQKGRRYGSVAAGWEHDRVARASRTVAAFWRAAKSRGADISLRLKNGATVRGMLETCDEAVGELRIRSGGEVRTVRFLDVATGSLCADREALDRAAFGSTACPCRLSPR